LQEIIYGEMSKHKGSIQADNLSNFATISYSWVSATKMSFSNCECITD